MDFDINVARSLITLVSLMMFIGLIGWTWAAHRKAAFDEAAQLPFLDDEQSVELSERK